ncbi:MAG: SDR family oxidoreductase [Salinisphaera sp.]|nr:SDR family oxidoreductase [Salinisphaera sp.]
MGKGEPGKTVGRLGKLLVTGAAGGLAKHVISRLKGDYRVVGVDFRGTRATHPDSVDYEVDFNKRTFEDVFREHDFDAIIHLGRVQSSDLDRGRRFSSNVVGTDRLLRLALDYGVGQVLVMSTYHVYGADPHNPSLIDEDFPLQAANLHRELVDAVELENLANIYLYKHPQLHVTILRPCNIAGPGVSNSISRLLAQRLAPCLLGFSPLMQFIHVEDLADAVVLALGQNRPGVYNVAPDDWITFQDALLLAGCRRLFLPSVPAVLPRAWAAALGGMAFPAYLTDFFRYAVVIDGGRFARSFGFAPRFGFDEIFGYYRHNR